MSSAPPTTPVAPTRPTLAPRPTAQPQRRRTLSRAQFEERFFGILRWVVIAFLAAITIVPFYYMLMLSVKPIDALLLNPGNLWVTAKDFTLATYESVLKPTSEEARASSACCSTRHWLPLPRCCSPWPLRCPAPTPSAA